MNRKFNIFYTVLLVSLSTFGGVIKWTNESLNSVASNSTDIFLGKVIEYKEQYLIDNKEITKEKADSFYDFKEEYHDKSSKETKGSQPPEPPGPREDPPLITVLITAKVNVTENLKGSILKDRILQYTCKSYYKHHSGCPDPKIALAVNKKEAIWYKSNKLNELHSIDIAHLETLKTLIKETKNHNHELQ
ncbi:hypothetical protein PQO03_11565 [Lentisphaera profundi]|uniref:Uncharacterized protein n=1 Tax=Lentisphaera profundi TaxID=1658616 RepID=A0ABY7VQR1_9BACT|nr:hypothetical protein [Lentisphaera profundi]WDE96347.1 hypothetical protein PQO03_11565 [Lentisphaera profundi]